jgi:hypothetical protein
MNTFGKNLNTYNVCDDWGWYIDIENNKIIDLHSYNGLHHRNINHRNNMNYYNKCLQTIYEFDDDDDDERDDSRYCNASFITRKIIYLFNPCCCVNISRFYKIGSTTIITVWLTYILWVVV